MAYDMDVVSKSKADTIPVTSFLDYNSYGNNNPVFIKKGNNTPKINLYARYSSDFTGSNSFTLYSFKKCRPLHQIEYLMEKDLQLQIIESLIQINAFNITLNKGI